MFRALRQENPGLGRTVALVPVYDAPPAVDEDRRMRIRGGFPTRPVGIRFDLAFENWRGTWWLYSIGIATAPPVEPRVDTPGGADGD